MSRDEPRVSVVIPTRNRAGYLPDALRSALGQKGVAVEVIVVDDGSDDETPAVLAAVSDARVRVVRNKRPAGQAAARNAGIRLARHEWTALLDDDDLWAPEKLRLQLRAAEDRGASWAYCAALMLEPDGHIGYRSPAPDPEAVLTQLLRRNVIGAGSSSVVASTELLISLGGFDELLPRLDDWDLWIRLAEHGRAAAVQMALVAYRKHTTNLSAGGRRDVMLAFRRIEEKHAGLAARLGVPLERGWVDRWLKVERLRARRSRADEHARSGRRFRAAALHLGTAFAHRRRADLRQALAVAAGEGGREIVRRLRHRRPVSRSKPHEPPEWLLPYLGSTPNGRSRQFVGGRR